MSLTSGPARHAEPRAVEIRAPGKIRYSRDMAGPGAPVGALEKRVDALGWLRRYWRPVLLLLVALPLLVYATDRSSRWIGRVFPGFFLMENAIVPTVSGYDWPPDRAATFHAQIVAVDGAQVLSRSDVYRRVATMTPGAAVEYELDRAGERSHITVPARRFTIGDYVQTFGILLFFAVTYLAAGLAVGVLQPDARQARVYLLQASVGGLFPILGALLYEPGQPLLTRAYFAAECLFPATFLHFATVFPVERRLTGARRALLAVPYLFSAALWITEIRGIAATPADLSGLHLAYLYLAASVLVFVVASMVTYYRTDEAMVRARTRAVVPGFVLATATVVIVFVNNASTGRDLPMQLALIPSGIFYIGLAYAIVKHDLFDVDRVVRQSFVYGVMSALLVGTYALLVAGPSQLLPTFASDHHWAVGTGFAVLVALIFDPLRRGIQRAIDRAFFRTRVEYKHAVTTVSALLTTLQLVRDIAEEITRVTIDAMHLSFSTLYLLGDRPGSTQAWTRTAGGALESWEVDPATELLLRRIGNEDGAGHVTRAPDVEGAIGVALLVPLVVGTRQLGALGFGAPRSGRTLEPEDTELLTTLSQQAALAIDNIRAREAKQADELLLAMRDIEDPGALLERITDALLDLFEARSGVAYRRRGMSYEPACIRGTLRVGTAVPVLPSRSRVLEAAFAASEPLVVEAWAREPTPPAADDRMALDLLEAAVIIPIGGSEGPSAFVTLGPRRSGDAYAPRDLRMLAAIGSRALQELQRLDRAQRVATGPLLIPSKYELIGEIGRGGMGIVYKVRHTALETIMALKLLPEHLAQSEEAAARFQREARVMAQLRHPNIVRVFDVDTEGDLSYFVMEYVDGRPLNAVLHGRQPPSIAEAVRIAYEVGSALACAHDHPLTVIHRDIKPSNILIEAATGRAVVTDFGIATLVAGEATLRAVTEGVGTVEYSAPEQLRGDRDVRPSADVYALGMVLFEMLNGRPYFAEWTRADILAELFNPASTYRPEWRAEVPAGLRAVVERATARDRRRRHQEVAALLADLSAYATDAHTTAEKRDAGQEQPPRTTEPNPTTRLRTNGGASGRSGAT